MGMKHGRLAMIIRLFLSLIQQSISMDFNKILSFRSSKFSLNMSHFLINRLKRPQQFKKNSMKRSLKAHLSNNLTTQNLKIHLKNKNTSKGLMSLITVC